MMTGLQVLLLKIMSSDSVSFGTIMKPAYSEGKETRFLKIVAEVINTFIYFCSSSRKGVNNYNIYYAREVGEHISP